MRCQICAGPLHRTDGPWLHSRNEGPPHYPTPDVGQTPTGLQDTCPFCSADLRGDQVVPPEHREAFGGISRYGRQVGVERSRDYDGVLYWQCPECAGRWHRFQMTDPTILRAIPYVEGGRA
jgi:hypothetical protein